MLMNYRLKRFGTDRIVGVSAICSLGNKKTCLTAGFFRLARRQTFLNSEELTN